MSVNTCLIYRCLSSASAVIRSWFIYELQKSTTIAFSRNSLYTFYSRNPTCGIPPCLRISNRKYPPCPQNSIIVNPPSPSEILKAVRGMVWIFSGMAHCPHTNSAGWFPHNSWGNLSTEFSLWGEGGWIGVCKSANPLWFINQIRPSIIAVNPKSRQKNFNYTQRPKSGSKNIWMRNPLWLQDPEIQKNLTLNLKSRQNYFQNLPIHSPIHPFPLW